MADAKGDIAFQTIVEGAPDAILAVGPDGRIVFINAEGERLFGYPRLELVGQRVELLIPEDQRAIHVIHREVYQERPERRPMGIGLELSGRRKDASTFPIEISLSPGETESLVVVVVRDVTRQRRTQLALRRSEERHRLLNERSESIVFRYRLPPEPGFEYVSAGVATQLGYAPEDFYVDERLLHAATHEDDRHVLDRALSPTPPHVVALRLLRRDGAVRWFELHLTVARDAEGVPVAVEGLAGDVTERRSADRELLQRQIEAQMQPEHSRTLSGTQDDLKPRANAVGWKPNAVPAHHRAIPQQLADHPIRELVAGIRKLRSLLHRSGRSGSGEI